MYGLKGNRKASTLEGDCHIDKHFVIIIHGNVSQHCIFLHKLKSTNLAYFGRFKFKWTWHTQWICLPE